MELHLIALISQLDGITTVVLFILCALSMIGWALFLYKTVLFFLENRQFVNLKRDLKLVTTDAQLSIFAQNYTSTVAGNFLTKIISYVKIHNDQQNSLYEYNEYVIDQLLAEQESYISFLTMSAAIAPLIGLFGTVWGLVNSFMSIGIQQSAGIATVAPGIAAALITTLAGLCVAIPAVALSSCLYAQVRGIEKKLQNLSEVITMQKYSILKLSHKKEVQCASVHAEGEESQTSMSH